MRVVLVRARLLALEALLPGEELLEVDLVAVEVRPSTQANCTLPSTVTRQEPHMPVPSTMIAFSETIVFTPNGRVVSTHVHHRERPDGDHEVGLVLLEDLLQRRRDEAGLAVGAVVGADDEVVAVRAELLPEDEILVPEADDAGGAVPASLKARSCG